MRVHVIVHGQVQGVFFRSQAKAVADDLGLTGWVRNNDDGSVETVAQGPKDKLDKFVVWCKKGPPAAAVDKIEVGWEKASGNFGEFANFEAR